MQPFFHKTKNIHEFPREAFKKNKKCGNFPQGGGGGQAHSTLFKKCGKFQYTIHSKGEQFGFTFFTSFQSIIYAMQPTRTLQTRLAFRYLYHYYYTFKFFTFETLQTSEKI